mgnify:CR=1 FL=1
MVLRHPQSAQCVDAKTGSISEAEFQSQIVDIARLFGYRIAHFRAGKTVHGWRTPVQGDGAGFPDCVMCKPGRLIFAELKRGKAKPTLEQQAWIDDLATTGAESYLWRTTDDLQEIAEILKGRKT